MLGSYSYFDKRVLNEEEEEDQPSDNGEKEQSGHTSVIQKKFLKERKIFLWGGIDDKSAKDITEKLLYLELSDPGKPIDFFMNTPGGSITAGMSIYDTMGQSSIISKFSCADSPAIDHGTNCGSGGRYKHSSTRDGKNSSRT